MNNKMGLFYFLCFLLSVTVSGCATVPADQVFPGSLYGVSLNNLCQKNDIHMDWDDITQVVTLSKDGVNATALIDSSIVLVNDTQILLREPVRLENGSILVSHEFQNKVISRFGSSVVEPTYTEVAVQPYIEPSPRSKPVPTQRFADPPKRRGSYNMAAIKEIILDAGHGGKDPGAIGKNGTREKEVVMDITRRLKSILEKNGIKVHLTRGHDEFISLHERTALASRTKADVFLSIHANASPKRSASGIEVFSLRQLNDAEQKDEKRQSNKSLLLSNLSAKNNSDISDMVGQMLTENKQSESLLLASKLTRDLSKTLRARNRGTKKAGFYVLRNTFIPAVLVEVGFLSNPKEERLLKTSSYRDKIARSIAKSLLDYNKKR